MKVTNLKNKLQFQYFLDSFSVNEFWDKKNGGYIFKKYWGLRSIYRNRK